VTQSILVEGSNRVRIFEPSGRAPAGFTPALPTLEDAYLLMMQQPAPTDGSEAAEDPFAATAGALDYDDPADEPIEVAAAGGGR
jgi:hypothetical protein